MTIKELSNNLNVSLPTLKNVLIELFGTTSIVFTPEQIEKITAKVKGVSDNKKIIQALPEASPKVDSGVDNSFAPNEPNTNTHPESKRLTIFERMLLDAAERGIKQGEAIVETENVFRDRTIQNGQTRTYNEKNKALSEDKNKAGKLRGLFSNLLQEETDYIEVDVVEIEPLMQNPLYRLMSKND
jgi:hypothetical protein